MSDQASQNNTPQSVTVPVSKGPHSYDWYKQSMGKWIDLNDPKTYEEGWFGETYGSLDTNSLRDKIMNTVGFSLYYMICNQPDVDWNKGGGGQPGQYARVVEFGKRYAREVREHDRWNNVPWLRKQLFLILDETENQC